MTSRPHLQPHLVAAVEELGRAFLESGRGTLREAVLAGHCGAAVYYQQLLRCTLQLLLTRLLALSDAEGKGGRDLLSPDPALWGFALAHAEVEQSNGGAARRSGVERGGDPRRDPALTVAVGQVLAAVPPGTTVADLGPLYECMLRYTAIISPSFRLVPGKERKQGGSYYTPPSLVAALIESALAPAVRERLGGPGTAAQREEALLRLRVCDPACGCGHFLLAATRHLARALLSIRGQEGEDAAYRLAAREVVSTSIAGVDLDPLAVALCRLALQAEGDPSSGVPACGSPPPAALRGGVAADHIKHGDSLLGAIDAVPADVVGAFQWRTAFAEVFAAGGFDVVLANPPWEMLQPEEVSFFAAHGCPDIAGRNGAQRKAAIAALAEENPSLLAEWQAHRRAVEATSQLLRRSGHFPLAATGKLNLSSAFVEIIRAILHEDGRAGCIVPSGLVTDQGTRHLFHALLDGGALTSLYHFDNRRKLFPDVSGNLTFCLLTLHGAGRRTAPPELAFFLHHPNELTDASRLVPLTSQDLALLNPNTGTFPIFRSRRDAALTRAIHRRVPILAREGGENPWTIRFRQGIFNMTSASHLFRRRQDLEEEGWALRGNVWQRDPSEPGAEPRPTAGAPERYLPLYEAKMMHHFDHRWADSRSRPPRGGSREPAYGPKAGWPRYWVPEVELEARLAGFWTAGWLLGYRLVCRSTDERSVVGTVLPRVGCGNSILVLYPGESDAHAAAHLVANLNSLILDYQARQKLGGINLNFHVLKQLPVLPPAVYREEAPWCAGRPLGEWIAARVLELVYTDHALQPFARDLEYAGDPFPWQDERRHQLRCELDAAYFYLYGLECDDAAYVLDTFAGVRRKEMARWGEYRTKRVTLQLLAEMLRGSARRPDRRICPAAN